MRLASRVAIVFAMSAFLAFGSAVAAFASSQNLYLQGNGWPAAAMSASSPPGGPLPDYDNSGDPGRLVKKDSGGSGQSDPTKFQQWSYNASGLTMDIDKVEIWAALKDFDDDKTGRFTVYLMDCGGTCSVIKSVSSSIDDEEDWKKKSVKFDVTGYEFGTGRNLVVKVVVDASSDDDMWFAYGTSGFNAHLKVNNVGAGSSTTTTAPVSTTTTTAPSATTTVPVSTTTISRSTPETSPTTVPADISGPEASIADATGEPTRPETLPPSQSGPVVGNETPPLALAGQAVVVRLDGSGSSIGLFEQTGRLTPQEGLMVVFSAIAESISVYWKAAIALGILMSLLLWLGVSRSSVDPDSKDEQDAGVSTH